MSSCTIRRVGSEEIQRVEPLDELFVEAWQRLPDDHFRWVEAQRFAEPDGEWTWQVVLSIAEFVDGEWLAHGSRSRGCCRRGRRFAGGRSSSHALT